MPCPVQACRISTPTAALLSHSPAEPRLGVTSISGFAVQGLGSECQNLKIKRQIVLIGCNYRLKRPSVEKEKKIPRLSISHRQRDARKEGGLGMSQEPPAPNAPNSLRKQDLPQPLVSLN